jgi:uncharacterized protein
MSSPRVQLVEKLYRSVQIGDVEGVFSCLHPEVQVHEASSLPYGGTFRGLAGVKVLLATISPIFEETVLDVDLIDDGSRVVARLKMKFKSHLTHRSVTMPVVEFFEFTDGLLSFIDIFPKDTKAICELGLAEVPI